MIVDSPTRIFLHLLTGVILSFFAAKLRAQYETEPPPILTLQDSHNMLINRSDTEPDGELERFGRWQYWITPRLIKGGLFPKPTILLDELTKYSATHSGEKNSIQSIPGGKWTPLGPLSYDAPYFNNGGTGRVNVIRFLPDDTSTLFIGSPDGGAWKSSDAGKSWKPLTDNIPNLGVSDIAIDPKNPHNIYLATGDAKDAGMYGNPYSYGILKSTDGGTSWKTSGLSWEVSDRITIPRIVVSPANSNVVFAGVSGGTQRGIQKSTDGGATWKQKDGGSIYDIEFNPADPTLIYASGYGNFRRSTDGGDTWTTITSTLPGYVANNVSRTIIGVTPADPNIVYILYISHTTNQIYGLYKSTDKGLNFTQIFDSKKNLYIGQYGEYNLVLNISPVNANTIIIGEQILAKSTDGGTTWGSMSQNIHYDNHGIAFTPKSETTFYSGNDGGIFSTTDGGKSWSDLSAGLQITQFYRLGGATQRSNLLYAGAQDNGIQRYETGFWSRVLPGADGGECLVDYSDENICYMEWQWGDLFRSDDGGNSVSGIAPDKNGHWITPYVINPHNPQTIYAAYRNVFRSDDRGDSWKTISPDFEGTDNLKSLALAPSNDSVIYTGTYVKLFRTTNAGSSWTDITVGSPIGDTAALTYIAISPKDPNKVWLTFTGFTDHEHVYTSSNGGSTWTNITGTLPNVPVNTIVYEDGSNDGIYIGTDIGVFYRDNSMTDWQPFMTGLPNVSVTELEINYTSGMLRAATFGRGVWESPVRDLAAPVSPLLISPVNDSTNIPLKPAFIWHKALLTSGYKIEIATDSLFKQIVASVSNFPDTSIIPTASLAPGTKYFWHVSASNSVGESPLSAIWTFITSGKNSVEKKNQEKLINYPNPFSSSTTFSFILTTPSAVSLEVSDLLGRIVSTKDYGVLRSGNQQVVFDAKLITAGSYFYTLISGNNKSTGILQLIK